jgi:peptidoglycan/xylan/chitin deacetylase (PgdA/CDA1 family)
MKAQIFVTIRRNIYLLLGLIDKFRLHRQPYILILCYHSIAKNNWRFSIDPEMFYRQIEYLSANYNIISLSNLTQNLKSGILPDKNSVIITFDDGYKDLINIEKNLNKFSIKPTVFLLSDPLRADRIELGTKTPFLKDSEISMLLKSGWEIGSHSATHPDFSLLSQEADLNNQIIVSKNTLSRKFKTPVSYFAFPKGRYSPEILKAIKVANYSLALSMDQDIISTQSNLHILPRVGVDRTHTYSEFKAMITPTALYFRRLIYNIGLSRWIP